MASESDQDCNRKFGFRVFKKSSTNGKITTYLSKRDFIGFQDKADPVEGVIILDPEEFKDKKIFCHVLASFRYGREALDVLGLTFRKYLFFSTVQVYPPIVDPKESTRLANGIPVYFNAASCNKDPKQKMYPLSHQAACIGQDNESTTSSQTISYRPLTKLQEKISRKVGKNAFPFYFVLPPESPASITLQSGMNEEGKPCGIDYELRTYLYDEIEMKKAKNNSHGAGDEENFVRLVIRKFNYIPLDLKVPQPNATVTKDFLMSSGSLKLEMTLDKGKYFHGESIRVNITIDNNSMKAVKKIKLSIIQVADIMLFNRAFYRCSIDSHEYTNSMPISPGQIGWCHEYTLLPGLNNSNRDKSGIALDGKLKTEETNLASTTVLPNDDLTSESLGIIVGYKVNAKLFFGLTSRPIQLELPFILCHPLSSINDLVDPLPVETYHTNQNEDSRSTNGLMTGSLDNSMIEKMQTLMSQVKHDEDKENCEVHEFHEEQEDTHLPRNLSKECLLGTAEPSGVETNAT